jgi:hypothetical protein
VSEIHWQALRALAIERFAGQTPRAEDEAAIIEHFLATPQRVERSISEIASALESGQVTWAWSALRARLERSARPLREVSVETGASREQAAMRAERWIRAAGKHFESDEEVVDELFGPHGMLREWRDDQALQTRMLDVWQAARPQAEAIEKQVLEHAARWRAQRRPSGAAA